MLLTPAEVAARAPATAGARAFRELRAIAFISAVAWGIGTNWLGQWFYPIRGISWGDLLFLGWFGFALLDRQRRRALSRALWEVRIQTLLMLTFVTLLLLATAINSYQFGASPTDLFAIVRLLYFSAIILFVYLLVCQDGYGWLLCGFLVGVTLLTLGRFYDAQVSGSVLVKGVILLKDPNVIGNMIGMGVVFCSLGILAGYLRVSLGAALFFCVASVMTFSKGTWLMVIFGLAANAVACVMLFRRTRSSFATLVPATMVLVVGVAWLVYANLEVLSTLVDYKFETTSESETADYRYQFGLAALHTMVDHPLWGLGFRNFPEVERLYPTIIPEPTENAHNAFLQVGAVAGVPALLVLLALVAYPFFPLFRALRASFGPRLAWAYVVPVFSAFALSGSVQLQLIAQPFFWIFTGIACGWHGTAREAWNGTAAVFARRSVRQVR